MDSQNKLPMFLAIFFAVLIIMVYMVNHMINKEINVANPVPTAKKVSALPPAAEEVKKIETSTLPQNTAQGIKSNPTHSPQETKKEDKKIIYELPLESPILVQ